MAKSVKPLWVPKSKRLIERVAHQVFSAISEGRGVDRKITASPGQVKRLASDLRALADLIEREVTNAKA